MIFKSACLSFLACFSLSYFWISPLLAEVNAHQASIEVENKIQESKREAARIEEQRLQQAHEEQRREDRRQEELRQERKREDARRQRI